VGEEGIEKLMQLAAKAVALVGIADPAEGYGNVTAAAKVPCRGSFLSVAPGHSFSHCSSPRVRCLIVSLICGRCSIASANSLRALSRLLPAYSDLSILVPSLVHFSTL
jgi:hypothetical protein